MGTLGSKADLQAAPVSFQTDMLGAEDGLRSRSSPDTGAGLKQNKTSRTFKE